MQVSLFKGWYVDVLFSQWQVQGLLIGILKNCLSYLCWWVEKIGKGGLLLVDNCQFGIVECQYSINQSKVQILDECLDVICDLYVQMSLCLQVVFGLCCQECVKFQLVWVDWGDYIVFKGLWMKGGKFCIVFIIMLQ